MPFKYERDDARGRIVISFEGAFELSEALASIERRRAENSPDQAVLYDIRHVAGEPTLDEIRELYRADSSIPTGGRLRGPLAIVAAASGLYTKACTFAALAEPRLRIRVFREVSEADSWLNAHASEPAAKL